MSILFTENLCHSDPISAHLSDSFIDILILYEYIGDNDNDPVSKSTGYAYSKKLREERMKAQQVEKYQICGSPIDEEMKDSSEKALYSDCALSMSAGGAAHKMAE
ncbi:MAG: hypothetical protein GY801_14460 [bacterium]|nr:hypothetical protein [bacterium]